MLCYFISLGIRGFYLYLWLSFLCFKPHKLTLIMESFLYPERISDNLLLLDRLFLTMAWRNSFFIAYGPNPVFIHTTEIINNLLWEYSCVIFIWLRRKGELLNRSLKSLQRLLLCLPVRAEHPAVLTNKMKHVCWVKTRRNNDSHSI